MGGISPNFTLTTILRDYKDPAAKILAWWYRFIRILCLRSTELPENMTYSKICLTMLAIYPGAARWVTR